MLGNECQYVGRKSVDPASSFPNVCTTTMEPCTIQTPLSPAFSKGIIDRDLTAEGDCQGGMPLSRYSGTRPPDY